MIHSRFAERLLLVALVVMASGRAGAQPARGIIIGRAVDSISGMPLPAGEIQLLNGAARARIDTLGRFELRDLPAGRHELVISMICWQRRTVTVNIAEGARVDLLDILMRKGACEGVNPATGKWEYAQWPACRIVPTVPKDTASNERVRRTTDSTGTRWHICIGADPIQRGG